MSRALGLVVVHALFLDENTGGNEGASRVWPGSESFAVQSPRDSTWFSWERQVSLCCGQRRGLWGRWGPEHDRRGGLVVLRLESGGREADESSEWDEFLRVVRHVCSTNRFRGQASPSATRRSRQSQSVVVLQWCRSWCLPVLSWCCHRRHACSVGHTVGDRVVTLEIERICGCVELVVTLVTRQVVMGGSRWVSSLRSVVRRMTSRSLVRKEHLGPPWC